MGKIYKNLTLNIQDFLQPAVCISCNQNIRANRIVCSNCQKELEQSKILKKAYIKPACLNDRINYIDQHISLFNLTDLWQILLHEWKFNNQRNIYQLFINELCQKIGLLKELQLDRIGYIDSKYKLNNNRNYQPCKDITCFLGKKLQLNLGPDLIKKTNKLQSKRNYLDRFLEMHNSLSCSLNQNSSNYLLVEDIYTTGATSNEAARMLKIAGVKKVVVISMLTHQGELLA